MQSPESLYIDWPLTLVWKCQDLGLWKVQGHRLINQMHRRAHVSIWWINTDRMLACTNRQFPQWICWCCFTDTHFHLVSHICWKGRLPRLCRHIPDLTISGNQSECSHKPYRSSLSPLTLPTPKRFMWHTYYADADQARVVFFSSLPRIILRFLTNLQSSP